MNTHPAYQAALNHRLTNEDAEALLEAITPRDEQEPSPPPSFRSEVSRRGYRAHLMPADRLAIRARLAAGETAANLADEYGVTARTVRNVRAEEK